MYEPFLYARCPSPSYIQVPLSVLMLDLLLTNQGTLPSLRYRLVKLSPSRELSMPAGLKRGWLHWHEPSERAFCFTCVSAFRERKLKCGTADIAFITRGYQNWKDATIAFCNHESSACHKQAVDVMITIPATHSVLVSVFLGCSS